MTDTIHDQVKQALHHFRLPRYDEITDVGLYLDQTTRYINEYMFPLSEDMAITSSMISNYVKIHLIPSPSSEFYRERIEQNMDDWDNSSLKNKFPEYMSSIYYFPTEYTEDNTHFAGVYSDREFLDSVIDIIF